MRMLKRLSLSTLTRIAGPLVMAILCAPVPLPANDWPTYQHDDARTGVSSVKMTFPLKLAWSWRSPVRPQMAWEGPAKRDPYNKVEGMKNRADFDRVFHPVIVGDSVLFGSSATDQVVCLDLSTGKTNWTYFTEGPIRFAPTVHAGHAYVGSDDGYIYCLNVESGSMLWKTRIGPRDERLPGNQRLVARWPVRAGVVVRDGKVYAGAGMFPQDGVYVAALDSMTGEVLWRETTPDLPVQGYLLASSTRLYVPSGRNNPIVFDRATGRLLRVVEGAGGTYCLLTGDTLVFGPGKNGQLGVVEAEQHDQLATFQGNHMIVTPTISYLHTDVSLSSLDRNRYMSLATERRHFSAERVSIEGRIKEAGKSASAEDRKRLADVTNELTRVAREMEACTGWLVECDCPHVLVLASDTLIAGGDGVLSAFGATDGRRLWHAEVDGGVYGLAVVPKYVIPSTDAGVVCAFRASTVEEPRE